ncbi:MAG: hypothetical protein GXN92_01405 [Candidatus Micrarchaeota archaeon]|nr:hypothetical protein [Candidatus Micrarchaeota archaeon]
MYTQKKAEVKMVERAKVAVSFLGAFSVGVGVERMIQASTLPGEVAKFMLVWGAAAAAYYTLKRAMDEL